MDFSIDEPLDIIHKIEQTVSVNNIEPMMDEYITAYNRIMNRPSENEISDEELASVWYIKTDMNLNGSYNFIYDDKPYIVKFHPITG